MSDTSLSITIWTSSFNSCSLIASFSSSLPLHLLFLLPLLPFSCSIYLFIVILGHLGFCIAFLDGSFEHSWFSSCISGIGPVLLWVAI